MSSAIPPPRSTSAARPKRRQPGLLFWLPISALINALLALWLVPVVIPRPHTRALLTLDCPMRCEPPPAQELALVYEREEPPRPEVPPAPPPPEPEQPEVEAPPEVEPPPEAEEPEEAEESEPIAEPEPVEPEMYMVELPEEPEEDEPPEDTQYLASRNSRVEEEHQAEETTLVETEPGQEESAAPDAAEPVPEEQEQAEPTETEREEEANERRERREAREEREARRPEPEPELEPEPQESAEARVVPTEGDDPTPLAQEPPATAEPSAPQMTLDLRIFAPTMESYVAELGDDDLRRRQEIAESLRAEGTYGAGDEERWERTRAALENMVPEARYGTETELNARRSEYAGYISYVHRRIHARWADDYLVRLDRRYAPGHPLSDPSLEAVLELVVTGEGAVERVNVVRSSGEFMFDGEAVDVAYAIGPLRPPPVEMLSDNGNTYIHWTFWRDNRACGTYGATVRRVR